MAVDTLELGRRSPSPDAAERRPSTSSNSSITLHEAADEDANTHLLHDMVQSQDPYSIIAPIPTITRPIQPSSHHRTTVFLDGLRGLAAFFVFIQHYMGGFDQNVHEQGFGQDGNWLFASFPIIRLIYSGGNAAVPVFFVLSGYVLSVGPLRMLKNGENITCGWSLVGAVVRRPFRLLVPAFSIGLIVALGLHLPGPIIEPLPWNKPQATIWAEIGNWWHMSMSCMTPFYGSDGCGFMGYPYTIVVWTMPVEFKGSMLIYGSLFFLAIVGLFLPKQSLSHQPLYTIAPLIITSVLTLSLSAWEMACFLFGLILAMSDSWSLDSSLLRTYLSKTSRIVLYHILLFVGLIFASVPARAGSPQFASGTLILGYIYRLIPGTFGDGNYYRWHQSWGALLIIYAILRIKWMQSFFSTRAMIYLGRISFMLYLVHIPLVLRVVGDRIRRALGGSHLGDGEDWFTNKLKIPYIGIIGLNSILIVSVCVTFAFGVLVSEICTRVVDAPSVTLGKWITGKLGLDRRKAGAKNAEGGGAAGGGTILPMVQVRGRD